MTSDNCFSLAADGTKTKVTPFSARFVDNGKGKTDVATIAINSATPTDDGTLKSGNIHVR